MSLGRFTIALALAATVTSQAVGQVPFDASGQVFLTFDFGVGTSSAGPRFGLRLGQRGSPQPDRYADREAREIPLFDNALSVSFDVLGRTHMAVGDVRLPIFNNPPNGAGHGSDVSAYYASSDAPISDVRASAEPPPLVTAAGPSLHAAQPHAAAESGQRTTPAVASSRPRGQAWTFRRLAPAAKPTAPAANNLMAAALHRFGGAKTPSETTAGVVGATQPGPQIAEAARWRFKPLSGVGVKMPMEPLALHPKHATLTVQLAMLLEPHSRPPGQTVQDSRSPTTSTWVFRQLAMK